MKGVRDPKTNKFVRNLQEKNCIICDVSFHPRFKSRKVCGMKCRNILLLKINSKGIYKKCEYCTQNFFVGGARSEIARFCSHACYSKSMTGKFGEESNGWQGGKTVLNKLIRSLNLYKEWRKKVLIRDNYTCIDCGGIENLDVDHIKSLSTIIREKNINSIKEATEYNLFWDIKNGRTLCRECHEKTPSYFKSLTKISCHIQ